MLDCFSFIMIAAEIRVKKHHFILALEYQEGGFFWYLVSKNTRRNWSAKWYVSCKVPKFPGWHNSLALFFGDFMRKAQPSDLLSWQDDRFGTEQSHVRHLSSFSLFADFFSFSIFIMFFLHKYLLTAGIAGVGNTS